MNSYVLGLSIRRGNLGSAGFYGVLHYGKERGYLSVLGKLLLEGGLHVIDMYLILTVLILT
jgi:hypothetical protein